MSIYIKKYEKLINEILDYYKIDKNSFFSSSREAHLVEARQIFAYCLRENFYLSFPAIGEILNRDHTTIMYAYNKIGLLINKNRRIKRLLKRLLGKIKTKEYKKVIPKSPKEKEPIIKQEGLNNHLNPTKEMIKKIGQDNLKKHIKKFVPKFKKDVKGHKFPIEFNKNYLSSIFDRLKKRHRSIVLSRYNFFKKDFSTLQKLVPTYNISRQRIKQIIDSSFKKIYFNNYGAVREIIVMLSKDIIKQEIVSVNSFKKQIYIMEKKNEIASSKFLFAIITFVHWIKIFEFSGNKFFINITEENRILKYIDHIKLLIKNIIIEMPDSVEDKWNYIYKNLKLDDYFQEHLNLLNEFFLRSCYDNYLFESEIVVFKEERVRKYDLRSTKKDKKISGIPNEYKIFFQ